MGIRRYYNYTFKVIIIFFNKFKSIIFIFITFRTLGIPARTITAFASAHDTDNSLTVDRFFNMNGEEIRGVNGDSVWNFHVWTE